MEIEKGSWVASWSSVWTHLWRGRQDLISHIVTATTSTSSSNFSTYFGNSKVSELPCFPSLPTYDRSYIPAPSFVIYSLNPNEKKHASYHIQAPSPSHKDYFSNASRPSSRSPLSTHFNRNCPGAHLPIPTNTSNPASQGPIPYHTHPRHDLDSSMS